MIKFDNSIRTVVSLILLFLTVSCKNANSKSYSFYHWNTSLDHVESINNKVLESGSDRLYIKFFDLEVNKNQDLVFPIATLQADESYLLSVKEIVPVIYIKNEVFLHHDGQETASEQLAINVASKIKRLKESYFQAHDFPEVHIDCDWTDSTQSNFFTFLKAMQHEEIFQNLNAQNKTPTLVSTLRLHQIKYRERTGVPPVKKVVIMAYNVGDLQNVNEPNSIINNKTTSKYLNRLKDYPLEYDVALPLFEWYAHYRDDRFIGVIPTAYKSAINKQVQSTAIKNKFVVSNDINLSKITLNQGDVLRLETVDEQSLKDLATHIKSNSLRDYKTIFYHINSPILKQITHEKRSQLAL